MTAKGEPDRLGSPQPNGLGSLTDETIISRLSTAASGGASVYEYTGRRASVLVPLLQSKGEWSMLFTRRSEWVNDHKGQVSFPGGAIEQDDPDERSAAVREAGEEIGLPQNAIRFLGQLDAYQTVTGFLVYPVIAKIQWPFEIRLNPQEVSRIFTIPLAWLGRRENFEVRSWHSPSGWRENVIFYRTYDGEQLWGISARIAVTVLQKLGILDLNL